MTDDRMFTHYPECWRDHHECAVAMVERLRAEHCTPCVVCGQPACTVEGCSVVGHEPSSETMDGWVCGIDCWEVVAAKYDGSPDPYTALDDANATIAELRAQVSKLQAEPRVHPLAIEYLEMKATELTLSWSLGATYRSADALAAWIAEGCPIYAPPIDPVDRTTHPCMLCGSWVAKGEKR